MSRESDRDQSIERVLKAVLPAQLAPASAACVDAETLAAWSDGALPSARAHDVERHLAECGRCQAMLAAFARTEPPMPEPRPVWERLRIRWLIPLGVAAAAAVVIWIALPKNQTIPARPETSARADALPPGSPPAAQAPAATVQPREVAKESAATRKSATAAAQPGTTTLPAPKPVPAGSSTRKAGATIDGVSVSAPPPAPAFPPAAVAAPTAQAPTAQARTAVGGIASAADRVPTLNETISVVERPVIVLELVSRDPAVDALQPVAAGAAAGRGGGGRGAGAGRGGFAAAQMISQTPARWRVLASGSIERSIDGGATWTVIDADAPPTGITAGAAPNAMVCWLAGRGGLVLLTTDGARFKRVTFPDQIDLSSIQAIDARQATVTTIDGRVFATEDGGVTWRRQTGAG